MSIEVAHHLSVAFCTLQGARVKLRCGEGDMAVTTLHQGTGHGSASFDLREADAVILRLLAQLHQRHQWATAGAEDFASRVAALETRKQQARWLVRQIGTQQTLILLDPVVTDADHHFEAGRHQHPLDGLHGIDEHRVRQRRDHHSHQVRA